mgnify:CR=1 FL=1
MTCKFCGSTIDDNLVECPYCGHRTGVVPAADPAEEMTEQFAAKETREEKPQKSNGGKTTAAGAVDSIKAAFNRNFSKNSKQGSKATSSAAKSSSGKSSAASAIRANGNGLIAIGLIACLLLCLISIISVAGMKKDLDSMNQNMLSLFYQIQNSTDQLQTKVEQLEAAIGTVNTTITDTQNSRYITITKQPSSVSTYLGRGSAEDTDQNVPIFTVYAQGIELSFTWQKYNESTKDWDDLTWDSDSNNATYGLHVYVDAAKGFTELDAHGVTQAAYGTYRCQIADSYGIKNTESVVLSQRQPDEDPT